MQERQRAQGQFTVRTARPDEVPMIAALDRQMWGDWANPITMYRQVLDLFPETVLVAHDAQARYAGCAVGLPRAEARTGWVLSVDLAEEFRGQGLGRLFVAALLQAFRKQGIETVTAVIDPENTPSQKLFTSFGFRRMGLEADYFGPGKHQERWVLHPADWK